MTARPPTAAAILEGETGFRRAPIVANMRSHAYLTPICGGLATMDSDADIAQRIAEAGKRALAEAEERRAARDAAQAQAPKEIGGRKGLDPTRYGDWEIKGIACDF